MEIIKIMPSVSPQPPIMYAIEYVQPGSQIDIHDRELLRDVEGLVELLASCARETAICVGLFESADTALKAGRTSEQDIEADRAGIRAIRDQHPHQLPEDLTAEQREEMMHQTYIASRQLLRKERLAAGEVPESYHQHSKLLHAKSFLYALDTIENSLDILVRNLPDNEQIRQLRDAFSDAFPQIELLRNSAHHNEDRVRMKAWNKKITIPAPPDNMYATDWLDGNRYGATVENGSLVWVEVSVHSAAMACSIVEAAMNALPWDGPPLPRN